MKLYKIENALGTYWVVAEHPTEAEQKLKKLLRDADYGFDAQREMISLTVIAESTSDTRFITNKFLIL